MKIVTIGPGLSSLEYKDALSRTSCEKFAFQEVFPNCVEMLGVIPDYWMSADPYAYLPGFETLLKEETDKYKNIKILVPSFFKGSLVEYRRYCGTTPLMRMNGGWQLFSDLLKRVSERYNVIYLDATTTKNIKLFSTIVDEDIFSEEAYYRFMHPQTIYGSIEFDSESVIGTNYKWGLENKLSSYVLPTCYHLGAREVYIVGFDMQGPRFYSDIARHPWNDETQKEDVAKIPLKILQKWIQWSELHGMDITSIAEDKHTKINSVIKYKKEESIL